MPPALIAAAVIATATVGSAVISSNASKSAAKSQAKAADKAASVQANAADQATGLQRDIYNTNRADLAPWREAGGNALRMLADSLGMNGPEGSARGTSAFRTSPGYDFAVSEGTRAVNSNFAAKRMTFSGAREKALTRFGQGTADQEFGSWIGNLKAIAGIGQTATNTTAQGATAYAQNTGNLMQDAAAARASGYVGSANAATAGTLGSANAISGGVNNLAKLAGSTDWSSIGRSTGSWASGSGVADDVFITPGLF